MKKLRTVFIVGFALFAVFFGAGNLIFPPFLGVNSGVDWFWSFSGFITFDVILSVFALIVIAVKGKGSEGITGVLGKKVSALYLSVIVLCIGPFICIPRTAATTFEMAVLPNMPGVNSWLAATIFFTIACLLSLKASKIIDIIGLVLSPMLLITLGVMIGKGVMNPIGNPVKLISVSEAVKNGISSGYQTMDMLGAVIFSIVILASIEQNGFREKKDKLQVLCGAGLVATVALFAVYCGLAYLGASASQIYAGKSITQAELIITLAKTILGDNAMLIFGLIVASACMTTAIGLLSSCAEYFSKLSKGKFKYEVLVIVFSVFSAIVSNFGISKIISLAAPILTVMYPVLVVLTILAAFSHKIEDVRIFKGAAFGAFIYGVTSVLESSLGHIRFTADLPLNSIGLGWFIPAMLGISVAVLFMKNTLHIDAKYN